MSVAPTNNPLPMEPLRTRTGSTQRTPKTLTVTEWAAEGSTLSVDPSDTKANPTVEGSCMSREGTLGEAPGFVGASTPIPQTDTSTSPTASP